MTAEQWQKGLLRLYFALALPWVLWFGHAAYEAHGVYAFNRDYTEAFDRLPLDQKKDWSNYYRAARDRDTYQRARNEALVWFSIVPIGYPVVALALVWVVAGFRRQ